MVRAIISWSLQNRLIVILGVLALIGAGVHSAVNLNVEAYPDPTPPLVEVISPEPRGQPRGDGAAGRHPAGDGAERHARAGDLRSTSIAGLNDIKCQFTYGTEYRAARQEVLNRIAAVDVCRRGSSPSCRPGARPGRSSATSWKAPATRPTSSRRCRTGC